MPSQAALDATEGYLEDEDALGAWMDECCNAKSSYYDTSSNLFASWKEWADRGGVRRIAKAVLPSLADPRHDPAPGSGRPGWIRRTGSETPPMVGQ